MTFSSEHRRAGSELPVPPFSYAFENAFGVLGDAQQICVHSRKSAANIRYLILTVIVYVLLRASESMMIV
jgi:hypothetical protein